MMVFDLKIILGNSEKLKIMVLFNGVFKNRL